MKGRYFFLPFLLFPALACHFSTTLSFENRSKLHIDSVNFFVNNYKVKITSIEGNGTKQAHVSMAHVQLNSHDFTVRAYIYVKDSLFRDTYNYNDLSGSPNAKYALTLNKDLTVKLW